MGKMNLKGDMLQAFVIKDVNQRSASTMSRAVRREAPGSPSVRITSS